MSALEIVFISTGVLSAAFVLGVAAGWSLAKQQISHRESLRRDLRAEVRSPIDVPFEVVVRRTGGA